MHACRTILAVTIVAVTACQMNAAVAQGFPSRPITVVVPFPAGGPLDVLARVMSERMRQALGQPLVIENVGGAGGTVGVGRVARASPDGYALCLGYLGTHALNAAIFNLAYDLQTDFEPVAMLPSVPLMLAGRRTLSASNWRELAVWLKSNPQKANIATPGVGSPSHVMAVYLQKVVDTPIQLVHYRGGGPALQDLVAGHVDLFVNQPSILLPHLRDKSIKVFVTLAAARLSQAPDIPSAVEEGTPDLQMSSWHGLWVPKATPRGVIDSLNAAVREALSDPTIRTRLVDLGYVIPERQQLEPTALAALQKSEIEKWSPIIKAAGVKPE